MFYNYITVVNGEAMNYQIRTQPPATSYSIAGTLPSGLTFNSATGVLSGTSTVTNTLTVTVTASNAKGDANASLTINSQGAKTAPTITAGTVEEVGGRTAKINGNLTDTGGVSNTVTFYYDLSYKKKGLDKVRRICYFFRIFNHYKWLYS